MSILITSFLTNNGSPIIGGSPTIKIWSLTPDTLVINGDAMTEVADGFYKYEFATYDDTKSYTVKVDAGISIPDSSRYYVSSITPEVLTTVDIQNITDGVWDEPITNHLIADTTGETINKTQTDVAQVRIDVVSLFGLVEEILKYDTNRTRIDKTSKTLTIYDNDGVTPLKVFRLRNHDGVASVEDVYERDPL